MEIKTLEEFFINKYEGLENKIAEQEETIKAKDADLALAADSIDQANTFLRVIRDVLCIVSAEGVSKVYFRYEVGEDCTPELFNYLKEYLKDEPQEVEDGSNEN